MSSKVILCGLLILLHLAQIECWFGTTHRLVARIAYDKLKQENPEVLNKCIAILEEDLEVFNTEGENKEKETLFSESAVFADTIKEKKNNNQGVFQNTWHYSSIPLIVDNPSRSETQSIKQKILNRKCNVVDALNRINTFFIQPETQKPPSYEECRNDGNDHCDLSACQPGVNLRFLMHYVGDIHQPLHNAERYSRDQRDKYQGDNGGNGFCLQEQLDDGSCPKSKQRRRFYNLHSYWDAIIDMKFRPNVYKSEFSPNYNGEVPLTDEEWEFLGYQAQTITSKYPESSLRNLYSTSFKDWNNESFLIAKNEIYNKLNQYEFPDDTYFDTVIEIAQKQVAKGGYRLAKVLTDLFQDYDFKPSRNRREEF